MQQRANEKKFLANCWWFMPIMMLNLVLQTVENALENL